MSLVCGIKLTHDGGIALLELTTHGPRLVAAAEVEKHDNRARHAELDDADLILQLLARFGYSPSDVSQFVVDG